MFGLHFGIRLIIQFQKNSEIEKNLRCVRTQPLLFFVKLLTFSNKLKNQTAHSKPWPG